MSILGFGLLISITVLLFQNCGGQFKTLDTSLLNSSKSSDASLHGQLNIEDNAKAYRWNGSDPALKHQVGKASGTSWEVTSGQGNGFLNYGPYTSFSKGGHYKVTFDLQLATSRSPSNRSFLVLDVHSPDSGGILATREVWSEELSSGGSQTFHLTFSATPSGLYEFRSRLVGDDVGLKLNHITVTRADEGAVGDFFHGKSNLIRRGALPSGEGWMHVENGVWYYFERDFLPDNETPSYCDLDGIPRSIGIGVRKSTDKGKTWSARRSVIRPSKIRGQDDSCSALDGTLFFNSEVGQYQILSQCIGEKGTPWKLCLYQSGSIDGVYSRVSSFSFQPRQIANLTCRAGTVCPEGRVYDEGTPEFLEKKFGYYYFTFHGYDGVHGYRLIARTRNFNQWEASGAGLPEDAIFTKRDCESWDYGGQGPCIGGGAASLLRSGDFLYMLVEAPTKNLVCVPGQFWPVGLVRSHGVQKTGQWQSAPRQLVIKPVAGVDGCGLQYAKFFRDGSDVYLHYFQFLNPGKTQFETSFYLVGRDRDPVIPNVIPAPSPVATPTPQPTPAPSGQNEVEYVTSLYRTILKREPDPAGLQNWVDHLQSGRKTREVVRQEFQGYCDRGEEPCGRSVPTPAPPSSPSDSEFVSNLYRTIFGREPDAEGMAFWVSSLQLGSWTRQKIQAHFNEVCQAGINECRRQSSPSDSEFVSNLYRTIFGREPDAEGMAFWVSSLQSGSWTRQKIQAHFNEVCRAGINECRR